jgi:hypothetical protein
MERLSILGSVMGIEPVALESGVGPWVSFGSCLGVRRCGGRPRRKVAGSALAVAILCANQAWAYAKMGLHNEALALLGRSRDEFARADLAEAPAWAMFFTETDMAAMVGTVYTELALTVDATYTRSAIPALSAAINGYGQDMTRSRSFNLISLATNHLLDDDIDHAAIVGAQAVAVAETVKTARTKTGCGR